MISNNYRRFQELKTKAKGQLNNSYTKEDGLFKAVIEVGYMRKEETPPLSWTNVESIIQKCTKHKAKGNEGDYRASISKMNKSELNELENLIRTL